MRLGIEPSTLQVEYAHDSQSVNNDVRSQQDITSDFLVADRREANPVQNLRVRREFRLSRLEAVHT